eukprot:CAMPEP_0195019480 /NCGR_PEP_ID=MMETSP0326_2-20130528/32842_1 /TAXON_ID=2866 ORGANISM="Crypthecodinium cohnii, Strain Seligo" /NCGR_SAMPLE_ID=MMETSP0326_2 /ASSEMBLY_ACC=CAM_ASM_000348 /LENGTH=75 /DNA_ID=CAMNT_0040037545 /DNA_START=102 /DNA_END=329 /DNA_ORIENTATION=+
MCLKVYDKAESRPDNTLSQHAWWRWSVEGPYGRAPIHDDSLLLQAALKSQEQQSSEVLESTTTTEGRMEPEEEQA